MPATISTNPAKQQLESNEVVLCRRPNGKGEWQVDERRRRALPDQRVGHADILSGGRADVEQIREVAAGASAGTP